MTTYAIEGQGASIWFSAASYAADLLSLTLPQPTVPAIETTHLGTTDSKTYKPGKLKDNGEVTCEFDHNPAAPSLLGVVQTFSISYPKLPGQTTPTRLVFSGFVKSQGGEEFKTDARMTTKITITVSGRIQRVPAT